MSAPAEHLDPAVRRVADLLAAHYKAACYAYDSRAVFRPRADGSRAGRWSCACGAAGPLERGDSATTRHREHVASVLVGAGLGRL